jgi:hypothetical protein
MSLYKHLTNSEKPIELLSRDGRPGPASNIPMPEEPLDYDFTVNEDSLTC